MTRTSRTLESVALIAVLACGSAMLAAQSPQPGAQRLQATAMPTGVVPPADYVLGAGDLLSVVFWGDDKDLSADVVVRPDGKISLSLLNDIEAGGLTPDQLRQRITEAAKRLLEDPTVSVVVREIKSRQVFITGEVDKPASYPLIGPTRVLQLISMAGGLKEYADRSHIRIIRSEDGRDQSFTFNYKEVLAQKNPAQNIYLKPGDMVIVP